MPQEGTAATPPASGSKQPNIAPTNASGAILNLQGLGPAYAGEWTILGQRGKEVAIQRVVGTNVRIEYIKEKDLPRFQAIVNAPVNRGALRAGERNRRFTSRIGQTITAPDGSSLSILGYNARTGEYIVNGYVNGKKVHDQAIDTGLLPKPGENIFEPGLIEAVGVRQTRALKEEKTKEKKKKAETAAEVVSSAVELPEVSAQDASEEMEGKILPETRERLPKAAAAQPLSTTLTDVSAPAQTTPPSKGITRAERDALAQERAASADGSGPETSVAASPETSSASSPVSAAKTPPAKSLSGDRPSQAAQENAVLQQAGQLLHQRLGNIDDAQANIQSQRQQVGQQMSALNARRQTASSGGNVKQAQALEQQVSALQNQLTSLNQRSSALQSSRAQTHSQIQQLQQAIGSDRSRAVGMAQDVLGATASQGVAAVGAVETPVAVDAVAEAPSMETLIASSARPQRIGLPSLLRTTQRASSSSASGPRTLKAGAPLRPLNQSLLDVTREQQNDRLRSSRADASRMSDTRTQALASTGGASHGGTPPVIASAAKPPSASYASQTESEAQRAREREMVQNVERLKPSEEPLVEEEESPAGESPVGLMSYPPVGQVLPEEETLPDDEDEEPEEEPEEEAPASSPAQRPPQKTLFERGLKFALVLVFPMLYSAPVQAMASRSALGQKLQMEDPKQEAARTSFARVFLKELARIAYFCFQLSLPLIPLFLLVAILVGVLNQLKK